MADAAEFGRLVRFGLVGGATAAIYFAVLTLNLELLRASYTLAVSISYVVSVIFQFAANKYFTFGSKTTRFGRQLPKYLVLLILNYLVTIVVVKFVVEILALSAYCGVLASVPLIMVIGYVLSRRWIFKDGHS